MIRNLGQQRHPEWVRKGRRFSHVLAIARETTAAAQKILLFLISSEHFCLFIMLLKMP